MQLAILGAGPAGLATAHYAHQRGLTLCVFERAGEPGGLCRTYECSGHRYDSGAHRFHERDADITADLQRLMGDRLCRVDAPSQILYQGRFIDFPPSPINWLRGRGLGETAVAAFEILRARLRPRPEKTFADTVENRYGRRIGKPLLIDYSEKLWGLPATELAPEVATRRLSGLDFVTLLAEIFLPRRKSAHLDGTFLYPRSGYGEIVARLGSSLPPGALRTGHELVGLECAGGRIVALRFRGRPPEPIGPTTRVVSTLPLTVTAGLLGPGLSDEAGSAARRLRFRHVRIVFLRLGVPGCSPNATIYLPAPRHCVSRVAEPRNRSSEMAPKGETSLVAEVPCSTGDALTGLADEELARRVIAELDEVGLIDRRTVLEWRHHFLANAYPVYTLDYAPLVDRVLAGLGEVTNLEMLGRGGRFWYSHLHDQMRSAKDYVRSFGSERTADASIAPHILRSARKL